MLKKYLRKGNSSIRDLANYQALIKRSVLLCFGLSFLFRSYSSALNFQMENPSFQISGGDFLTSLYNYFGINYFVFAHPIYSIVFAVLLFIFWVLSFIFPNKKAIPILFYIFFLIYAIGFNSNMGFLSSYLKGFIIIGFIFFVISPINFNLMWEGLRYYACWIYFSAFLWKFIHRAMFMPRFGEISFKDNLSWYIFTNPDSILSKFYLFCIEHSWILNIGDKLVFLFEGLYFIGFFTKKYDAFLGWGIVGLHLFLYFFSDTLFVEIWVLGLLFISKSQWSSFSQFTKILHKYLPNFS
ncbi:GTP cyclohydrolase [Riemerella anatipestifer]|uniref:GTP cyclohydrolase n=1 Tax=Riemerella anatipestifer TaxID=34085 RepID=UPI000D141970|nr:GTP cyclohydrolase [Riemerella anatipestifer]MDD1525107.1 GTP cyclohydrolase [Riemerella anatipestifer]PST44150.1 GTP cyclohydrolase [Riemerella anatipestifer]